MPFQKNLQMVVTVVLLVMAAAGLIYEEELTVPQTLELRIDRPTTADQQFSAVQKVDTNTTELLQSNPL